MERGRFAGPFPLGWLGRLGWQVGGKLKLKKKERKKKRKKESEEDKKKSKKKHDGEKIA